MASSVASLSSSNVSFGHVLRHQSDNNILKLKLRKPKLWNWELSTSKSSANIDFPRILLYDSNNKLLADVNEADFVINGKENEPHSSSVHFTDGSKKNRLRKSCSFSVSNSTLNSPQSSSIIIRSDDRCSSLKTDSSLKANRKCTRSQSITSQCTLHKGNDDDDNDDESISKHESDVSKAQENEKLPEVPIYIYSAKGLVKRDFNAKEFDAIRNRQNSQDSGKNSDPPIINDIATKTNLCTITKQKKINVKTESLAIDGDQNSLSKCTSMAELIPNGMSRKKSRRKIRRTKSMNLSSSSLFSSSGASSAAMARRQIRNASTSSSDENDTKQMSRKPVYHIQKSAAGAIIVPEEKKSAYRRIRRRHQRSNSSDKLDRIELNSSNSQIYHEKNKNVEISKSFSTYDIVEQFSSRRHHHHRHSNKTDTLLSNVLLSHELDSNPMDKNYDECINDINEITARASDGNSDNDEHLVSIKNNQPNVKNNGRASSANSYNNVNNGINDAKQKKTQLNRKVSFVQFNCEMSNDAGNDCTVAAATTATANADIHNDNDWIDVRQYNNIDLNQNEKCINNTSTTNERKKVFHGKIKKSASIASFYNNNYTSSDTDDGNAISTPVRHKKRRKTQRPKSSSSSHQYYGE